MIKLELASNLGIDAISVLFNTKNAGSSLFNAMRNKGRVKPRRLVFELFNFDNDCTKGGTKVQPCDAASHRLTAYKSNFQIELLQYWKACSFTAILLCWSIVHHCLLF